MRPGAPSVRTIAAVEDELIGFALRYYRGQMSEVARRLGIGRSTLYRKLKDYSIDPDDPLKQVILEEAGSWRLIPIRKADWYNL